MKKILTLSIVALALYNSSIFASMRDISEAEILEIYFKSKSDQEKDSIKWQATSHLGEGMQLVVTMGKGLSMPVTCSNENVVAYLESIEPDQKKQNN